MLLAHVHFVLCLLYSLRYFTLYIIQQNATLTNREVSDSSADPANKAKLILLLGGFNNTGELESQLKRISMPPISSEPLPALMIMECHQHSYTVQCISFDMRTHTHTHKTWCINACTHTQPCVINVIKGVSLPLKHMHACTFYFVLSIQYIVLKPLVKTIFKPRNNGNTFSLRKNN